MFKFFNDNLFIIPVIVLFTYSVGTSIGLYVKGRKLEEYKTKYVLLEQEYNKQQEQFKIEIEKYNNKIKEYEINLEQYQIRVEEQSNLIKEKSSNRDKEIKERMMNDSSSENQLKITYELLYEFSSKD